MFKFDLLRFNGFNENWNEDKFENIFDIKNGLNKGKDYFGKGIQILNYMDVNNYELNTENTIKGLVELNDEEIKRYSVKPNDLFFTRTSETSEEIGLTSAYVGKEIKCVFSGFLLRARPKMDVNSLFFAYYFRSPKQRNNIIKFSSITTRALISGGNLSKMKIKFPNIGEQNKITKLFLILNKKIQLLEKKYQYYQDFKKYLMQQIFTQKLRFDFVEVKLKDISKINKGEQLNKDVMIEDGKYYVLNGGKDPSGYTNEWNVSENTITISEGGNSCGYVNFNTEKFWSGGHCYYLSNLDENVDDYYLYNYLKFKEKFIMHLRVGSGLPNIQKRDIENIKIQIISKNNQNKISNLFLFVDKKINSIQIQKENFENFKKGLLQQMFV